MGYLALKDYTTTIQDRLFVQLVQNDFSKRLRAENAALDIVISYLTQKYDVNQEFFDLLPWSPTKTYNIRDRVIIDYTAWVASTSYVAGDCVIYSGNGYVCKTANSDVTFTSGNWDALGAQYSIYFASFPDTCTYRGLAAVPTLADPLAPMFDVYKNYLKGDIAYWKNNTYVCNAATNDVKVHDLKQYYVYQNVPLPNVFPDDMVNNANQFFWSLPTVTVVDPGTLPTDDTAWTLGDNRNPQLLECMKHLTIWILSELIVTNKAPVTGCAVLRKEKQRCGYP